MAAGSILRARTVPPTIRNDFHFAAFPQSLMSEASTFQTSKIHTATSHLFLKNTEKPFLTIRTTLRARGGLLRRGSVDQSGGRRYATQKISTSENVFWSDYNKVRASQKAENGAHVCAVAADVAGEPNIESCFWEWRYRWQVHYEVAGTDNRDAPAILLLPGFGVGTFHFHEQLRELGTDHRIWALDFFGQGKSWPSHDPAPLMDEKEFDSKERLPGVNPWDWGFGPKPEPWAEQLVYSVDLWKDQVTAFVNEVIGEPVFVVGNSLGGYVGLSFAAQSPDLIRGITLLNATPFWAFSPNPNSSPTLAKFFPWKGTLPIPQLARMIARHWWDRLRDPAILRALLNFVYVDSARLSDELIGQIAGPTKHPAAASAFASILFAPKGEFSFDQNLRRVRDAGLPICLIYGREDPWIVPLWGWRIKRAAPSALYYEITPAGHCPHHETPHVVNGLLRGWIMAITSAGSAPFPLHSAEGVTVEGFQEWRDIAESRTLSAAAVPPGGTQAAIIKVQLKAHSPSSPVAFVVAAFRTVSATWQRAKATPGTEADKVGQVAAVVSAMSAAAESPESGEE